MSFFLSLVHHEYHRLERLRGWGRMLPRLIQDIILWHKVDVLALFETRVSGDRADKVLGCLGFEQWVKVDVLGFCGGLWVLWNKCVVHMDVLHVHPQFIHTRLVPVGHTSSFFATFTYTSPTPSVREEFWG